jgi:hypothetical protein
MVYGVGMRSGGMRRQRRSALATLVLAGCFVQSRVPEAEAPEAQVGRCASGVDRASACGTWSEAVASCGGDATTHTSFPQLSPAGCHVEVRYETPDAIPTAGEVPAGCGYPTSETAATLEREARRYDEVAEGKEAPLELACALPDAVRARAATHNARTLRATARRLASGRRHPYAAVATFGFGHLVMNQSRLVDWLPGDGCRALDKSEMDYLGVNRVRAARAAAAYHGGIAPVVTVSGGAIHADLVEAFMLLHLATCRFGVPDDAVLLDPCADHTHTNVRNTGSLVIALGGRTAYVVTDSGLQGGYLQDWTSFDLIGGSIDQRALRDWGYLVGSWHRASVGLDAGFWFTPYRFWGADDDLARLTCVRP